MTTHKMDLLKACRDQVDRLDPLAELMGEISSISKDDEQLVGHAKGPVTSGLALEAFFPDGHRQRTAANGGAMRLAVSSRTWWASSGATWC